MQRLSGTEPSPARGVDSLSAAFGRLHPETATDLGLEDRARSAGDRLRNALGDVRLLLYAEATLRNPACLWKPSAAVDRWLSEQRIDVVSRVFDLLWDVCERPEDYPELYADGELTSQLAAVPGTDVVIITFTVTDGPPRVVHGVHIERDTRFWVA